MSKDRGNNQPPLSFGQKKVLWKSQDFINELFGYPKNTVSREYDNVQNYLEMIDELEDRKTYYMAAYGSLMNINDVDRTIKNLKSHQPAMIAGWERIFNMGNTRTGSYLNVRENDQVEEMLVSLLEIPIDDMPAVIARESNYQFEWIDAKPVFEGTPDTIRAFMVVGVNESSVALDPQMNYLHLCLSGAGHLLGIEGVNNFLDTTNTYQGNIREWFKNVDLLDYMWRHDYLKR